MQASGLVNGGRETSSRSHLCWRYDRLEEFLDRAREFLAEGLTVGERVCLVAPGEVETLAGQLRTVDALDEGFRRGAVQVTSLDGLYPVGTVIDPAGQVRTYAAATEEALAAGFTGLRVAAEATDLIRTPRQLDAFARYEHQVDRFMVARPFSAMCAYNRSELGDDAVAQIACMHPQVNQDVVAFRLHARGQDESGVALDGELDMTVDELLPLALERAQPRPDEGRIVVDATGVRFMDHRSLLVLADYADRHDVTVVLRTKLSTSARICELLELSRVRVEQVA